MDNPDVISSENSMSDLVGMWAIIWLNDIAQEEIKCTVFIYGKADDEYFIVQTQKLTDEPNVAHLRTIKQMKYWTFLPTFELVNQLQDDIAEHGKNRFKVDF